MAKLEKLYEIIDKENFEPGGTLEERVSVLEEVLQEQVMAAQPQKKMINGMPPKRWLFRCQNSRRDVIPCECT